MNKKILEELTGQTKDHLFFHKEFNCFIHKKIFTPLVALNEYLKQKKIKLHVVSSFRSYEHQKKIWEEKVSGKRVLLDEYELPVDISKISSTDLLFLILNWSMIPGFSRHHLGCDLDVCDLSGIDPTYQIKLINEEYEEGGPFFKLHTELDELIKKERCFGFFRPYTSITRGVKPEKWHISHKETADSYLSNLSLEIFEDFIDRSDLSLKREILDHSEIIFDTYIKNY